MPYRERVASIPWSIHLCASYYSRTIAQYYLYTYILVCTKYVSASFIGIVVVSRDDIVGGVVLAMVVTKQRHGAGHHQRLYNNLYVTQLQRNMHYYTYSR